MKLFRGKESLRMPHLSPREKKKRDILIPVTITAAVYLVSMGISEVVDIVPDAMQMVIDKHIQPGFLLTVRIFNNISLFSSQIYLLIIGGKYVQSS